MKPIVVILVMIGVCYSTPQDLKHNYADIDGDYIVELGNHYNYSLLKLVGAVYKTFENNLQKHTMSTRIGVLIQTICDKHECDEWSGWSECTANAGDFGLTYRSRKCGLNDTRCTYPAAKERTEHEKAVCVGIDEKENATEITQDPVYCNELNMFKLYGKYCLALIEFPGPTAPEYFVAADFCRENNGTLVTVTDTDKEASVFQLLNDHKFYYMVWIDGFGMFGNYTFNEEVDPEFSDLSSYNPKYDRIMECLAIVIRERFLVPCDEEIYHVACEHK